ncbi:MAG: UDP-N-acetylmuramate dehydrogenase [Candidatus Kapaibacteriota bacterium]
MITLQENVSLKSKNTFAIDSRARYYSSIQNEYQILSLLESNVFHKSKSYFLGGGSNSLFVDDYDGIVVHLANRGISIVENNKDFILLQVDAGVNWHKFVEISLMNNYFGLENLALIPGNVGGAIAQNIGAYGVELKKFVQEVRGVDTNTGHFFELENQDCKFGYRSSIFKTDWKGTFIITSAKFRLSKKPNVNLTYPELKKLVKKFPFVKPDPKYVFEQVCKLRTSKLPDIEKYPNAGSFFKNPIVNKKTYETIKQKFEDLVFFELSSDAYKIPAGWLIEKAGWKGKRIGNVGTYTEHALVIVNYGVKKGREILEFAKTIQNDVREKFGIELEFEVEIVE